LFKTPAWCIHQRTNEHIRQPENQPGMPSRKLQQLTIPSLKIEAGNFAIRESGHPEPSLYGVTDGKAVGTYLEHKFQNFLRGKYLFDKGSSAKGIDFPGLDVDIKVTSIKQPQSSCPSRSARQKVYGLGYHLLVFVYDKTDDKKAQTAMLNILHTVFVDRSRTGDFQTTSGLLKLIGNEANSDDIIAYFQERMLPLDDIQAEILADEVLKHPPELGYLTISNALQWRLQYNRVITKAGAVEGIEAL
jgi:hypothetical protein